MIDEIRKANAFFNEAIEVYETLKRSGGEPEPRTVAVPLLYKRMAEYNRTHHLLDPLLLFMAGKYLSIRYRELNKFFTTPDAQTILESAGLEDLLENTREERTEGVQTREPQDSAKQEVA